ncbi:DUF4259 domain-containing protein [Streptomyces sp. NPDC003996]
MDAPDAERAVAAAALVVAQHPDGEPACSNYGPPEPLREFPADLRTLAIDALHQAVAEQSELAELWGETADGPKWRQGTYTRVWQASAVRRADVYDKRQRQCTPAVTQPPLAEVATTRPRHVAPQCLRGIRPRSLPRKTVWRTRGDHCYLSAGRARDRGGGTLEGSPP